MIKQKQLKMYPKYSEKYLTEPGECCIFKSQKTRTEAPRKDRETDSHDRQMITEQGVKQKISILEQEGQSEGQLEKQA